MATVETHNKIRGILASLAGLEPLKDLFWSVLNYDRVNEILPRRNWPKAADTALADDPVLFAGGGERNDFHIIYARLNSKKLTLTKERPVVSTLLKEHPYSLFIFSNVERDDWHFVNVRLAPKRDSQADPSKRRLFRRITVGPDERVGGRLRTAAERLALLDLERINPDFFGLSPLTIQEAHDGAFDVEKVTEEFFDEYQAVYRLLYDGFRRQTKDRAWAHDYALQFLNRVMFLYFVQRKRWLDDDGDFLRLFWEAYKDGRGLGKDEFFEKWLQVLFFKTFNGQSARAYRQFPDNVTAILDKAPYLNGGLFRENELDLNYSVEINDRTFVKVFDFFERYNFTISESTLFDQEVAVDPEMIGKVYESLVNVSEEADEKGDAGIFYTPRTEIDLMCRLTLVDYLSNHLGNDRKDLLYDAVFTYDEGEQQAADKALNAANLWPDVDKLLRDITVLDPACGSGSFLVGMLQVLDGLLRRAGDILGRDETPYRRKTHILQRSLYGVDVMRWAVDVAELRLWLQLVIDTHIPFAERKLSPLLPNLSFKVRCGDSLVQEIGGVDLSYLKGSRVLPAAIKGRITALKGDKAKYFYGDPKGRFRSEEAIKRDELRLFDDILDARRRQLDDDARALREKLEDPHKPQLRLDGTAEEKSHQLQLQAEKWRRELEELDAEREQLDDARAALTKTQEVPFVWDVAFVEVFEGDDHGFDVVIGNPPYVRQENIGDPRTPPEKRTAERKRAYKDKLIASVYNAFPRYFGLKGDSVERRLDAKSDLYIYFFFHGLWLVAPGGSFCFITSNSWLDVGYGRNLQEFLLRQGHVKMVLDNQVRRSFSNADVNTVISLLAPPERKADAGLDNVARFAMFKVPFDEAMTSGTFKAIEKATTRTATDGWRVHAAKQNDFLEAGGKVVNGGEKKKTGTGGPLIKVVRYLGGKWGGKYLRAPDIYWRILDAGKTILTPLGVPANVRFGVKTGANAFFYLNKEKSKELGIEKRFLKPVIISPRESTTVSLSFSDLKYDIFLCNEEINKIKGTCALEYIRWGESMGFDKRPSCRNRERWYSIPNRVPRKVLWPMIHSERLAVFWNERLAFVDHNLFELVSVDDELLLCSLLWTGQVIFRELLGRVNLGQGALKTEGSDIKELPVFIIRDKEKKKAVHKLLINILNYQPLPIKEEVYNVTKRDFDRFFFDLLGLSNNEIEDVYECASELIKQRSEKSLNK